MYQTNLIYIINRSLNFLAKGFNKLHLINISFLISKFRINIVLNYYKKCIPNALSKNYNYQNLTTLPTKDQPIFVMWLQGEENMPLLVHKCYIQMKKYFENRNFILITEQNYKSYITLDSVILDNYKNGVITRTMLSDIIRAKLLYEHGGLWIDSTVFLSSKLPENYFESDFYGPSDVIPNLFKMWKYLYGNSNGWNGWFTGTNKIHHPYFDFLYNSFLEYFENTNKKIDYFQIDFFTRLFYDSNKEFKQIIDERNTNNQKALFLANLMNLDAKPENIEKFNALLKEQPIHKLSYKKNWDFSENSGKLSTYFINKEFNF